MRIVAVRAIALRARVLKLGLLDLVGLIRVAPNTDLLNIRLCQNNFSVLRRFMTDLAKLFSKGRMDKGLHQFRLRGLMGIVT